jgi:tetratricopeptide (TPR) repeat protein
MSYTFLETAVVLVMLLCCAGRCHAGDSSFTNALAQSAMAAQHDGMTAALPILVQAEKAESTNSPNLCALARRYCDLMYLTPSTTLQRELADRALECSLQAVRADSNNPTAHACLAVCYAKNCPFSDTKTKLTYSRLFKIEAEKTIALDPTQDIAYYLLGRWNYSIANIGLVSRAFVKVVYGGLPKASNEEAVEDFKKAIQLAPGRIIHHQGLAMAYEALGRGQLEVMELKKCRALKPAGLEDQDAQREAEKTLAALGQ